MLKLQKKNQNKTKLNKKKKTDKGYFFDAMFQNCRHFYQNEESNEL